MMNIHNFVFAAGFVSTSALSPAPLLGRVGTTTASGLITHTQNPYTLAAGQSIFGPFEAGFSSAQDFILESLGCSDGSLGHVPGGIDTHMAEQMVATQCGITLPRYNANGIRISLLDECGGHTRYHFHERLRCLYSDQGQHSEKVGVANDGHNIYGKFEDASTGELPLLDACGGHWGFTPESLDVEVYHYHVQDRAPFVIGCYGPNEDGSLVTVEQCRSQYSGCNGQATQLSTGADYELWCPCYDADGSNHGKRPLPVFTADFISSMPVSTPTLSSPVIPLPPSSVVRPVVSFSPPLTTTVFTPPVTTAMTLPSARPAARPRGRRRGGN